MSRKILSISAFAALLCFTSFAAQAAEVHEQLVAALRSGAGAYALTEAANVTSAGLSGI